MVQTGDCRIDDFGPIPVFQPQLVSEVSDLVGRARSDSQAIYPLGGQTMLGLGLPPTRAGLAIDLRSLTSVIDYPARDMTITVQAGMTLAKLRDLLALENQRLPIDVPLPDRATLGGSLAANVSGSRRYGFGTLRDYLIGFSAVNDEGHEIKAGGRVVKNVAGYDLAKLFIGSLGTLGIITQATLKLKPRPEAQAMVAIPCPTDRMDRLFELLHETRTRPVCIDLLSSTALQYIDPGTELSASRNDWLLLAGYEDNEAAVSWQTRQLVSELGTSWTASVRAGPACDALWRALAELPAFEGAILTFKAGLLPHAVGPFCRLAMSLHEGLVLQANAGNGIVRGHLPGDLTRAQAEAILKSLGDSASAVHGSLVIARCPPAWKLSLPVWGRPRGDASLMRILKEKLDPQHLFNPGRFLGF